MKKIMAVMLCVAVVLGLAACGEKPQNTAELTGPSRVVAEALDAAKSGDYGTVLKVLDPDEGGLGDLKSMVESKGLQMDVEQQTAFDRFAVMLRDFDYEIKGEKITGDKAEVEVALTTYDYQSVLRKVLAKMSGKALGMLGGGDKEQKLEELKSEFVRQLEPALEKAKSKGKNKTTVVTVNLTKDGDDWKLAELSDDTVNALTGGLVYEVSGLAETLDF